MPSRPELRRRRHRRPDVFRQPRIEQLLAIAIDAEGADESDRATAEFRRTFTPSAVRGLIALAIELDDRLQAACVIGEGRIRDRESLGDLKVPFERKYETPRLHQIDSWLVHYHGNVTEGPVYRDSAPAPTEPAPSSHDPERLAAERAKSHWTCTCGRGNSGILRVCSGCEQPRVPGGGIHG